MTANVVRVNSNYKIQSVGGGQIILDTGTNESDNPGTVVVLGNLDVIGVTSTIETNNTVITDNILTLNNGEMGPGVIDRITYLPGTSGLRIDRGSTTNGDAEWIWDESKTWLSPTAGALTGLWTGRTTTGLITGILTNSITTDGSDLYLINTGTSVVSVTGTNNYEQQVLDYQDVNLQYKDKDIIPNIKAVSDLLIYSINRKTSNNIRRDNSSVFVNDNNITEQVNRYETGGSSNHVYIYHEPFTNESMTINISSFVTISNSNTPHLNGTWPVITAASAAQYFVVEIGTVQNYPNLDWSGNIVLASYMSNVSITVDGLTSATFYDNHADISGINITGTVISTESEDNLTLTADMSVVISATTASTDYTTGSLIVNGGAGIAGDVYINGSLSVQGDTTLTGHVTIEGVTSTGATGTGNVVFDTSPSISNLSVTGHLTVESVTSTGATGSGNLVFSASPTFSGSINANSNSSDSALLITTSGSTRSISITDTGVNGANIKLIGNGSTTPNKTIRSQNGNFQIINDAYGAAIFTVSDEGNTTTYGYNKLNFQASAPAASSDGVIIYTKNNDLQATGIYFINNTTSGELISKSKALAYSFIFG
jgi:hypothetical protein